MKTVKTLEVWMQGQRVGTLAETLNKKIAFEYDASWLLNGYSISPLSLPLEKGVFIAKPEPFEGLFGVFADSLPDGWGRLLVDRMLLREKQNPHQLTPLQRLAIVGNQGMGALEYHPVYEMTDSDEITDLDRLSEECSKILSEKYSDDLDMLFTMGGSSGGARPKIFTKFEGENWLIKFPSTYDSSDIGYEEYLYALCAVKCGINVEKVHLFPSQKCKGYFGTRRFDRINGPIPQKVHMITVSGMLETSHRIPNLDYHTLMKLTWIVTKDYAQLEQLYRRMCFNVFSHNRDDHSKNFSFLYDTTLQKWMLTPSYDMTYSNSIGGEHATCVDGNGANPGMKELMAVGVTAGISELKCREIAEEIKNIIDAEL